MTSCARCSASPTSPSSKTSSASRSSTRRCKAKENIILRSGYRLTGASDNALIATRTNRGPSTARWVHPAFSPHHLIKYVSILGQAILGEKVKRKADALLRFFDLEQVASTLDEAVISGNVRRSRRFRRVSHRRASFVKRPCKRVQQ